MRRNKIFILSTFFLLVSCSQKMIRLDTDTSCILNCNNKLICYKYLYNDDNSFALNEKRFWKFGVQYKEFAYKSLDISFEDMTKSITSFEKKENMKVFIYTYAFINNCRDTIYADYNLNNWIIKKEGKANYYQFNKNLLQVDTLNTKGLGSMDKFFKY